MFSKLEENFDKITNDNIWSSSKPRPELYFFRDYNVCKLILQSKHKSVNKLGKEYNRFCPDFLLLTDEELAFVTRSLYEASVTGSWRNPFYSFTPKQKYAIELFGDYWHSEKVIGIEPTKHVEEVKSIYKSIGWEVDIIWESDFYKGNMPERVKQYIGKKTIKPYSVIFDNDIKSKSIGEKEKFITQILNFLRNNPECYLPDMIEVNNDLDRFLKKIKKDTSVITTKGNRGNKLCRYFVKEIDNAKVVYGKSFDELWNDDKELRNAIERQYLYSKNECNNKINAVANELIRFSNFRKPSNFPPLAVVKILKSLDMKEGDKLFDPCAGFGGRLLGCWALGIDYYGVDANKKLVEELNEMARFLNKYKKRNNIEIIHGDSSEEVFQEKKEFFDIVFTSPPYFDLEIYSNDKEQAINKYPIWEQFKEGFFGGLCKNINRLLKQDGKVLLNVPCILRGINFENDIKEVFCKNGFTLEDKDIINLRARKSTTGESMLCFSYNNIKEKPTGSGIKNAIKNYYVGGLEANKHYVVCQLCNERFARLSKHIKNTHGITKEKYLELFPDASLISQIDSERVKKENSTQKHDKGYKRRYVYLCKDGRYVFRKNVWLRIWENNPPNDTIFKADEIDLNEINKPKGIEGIDYVTCDICGHTGKNITQHIEKEHDINRDEYNGKLSCEKFIASCKKRWQGHVKKEKKTKYPIKTTKNKTNNKISKEKKYNKHSFTKELLEDLYINQNLSDREIGARYGMTGEGIAYQRKKYEIKTKK